MRNILLFFFTHRTLALLRWDIYFVNIRVANFLFRREKKLLRLLKKHSRKKYLNLGSGPRGIDNDTWINIDGFKDRNVHYLCDISRGLPFYEKTFDGIFCEHVLEHFDYDHGKKLMEDCCRILKPGGVLRIIVPDGHKILKSYFDEPSFISKYKQCDSIYPMEAVNKWFYQRYEHQCIYDGPYLIDMLLKAGFSEATKISYLQTTLHEKELVIDDEKYNWESLYVEAVK